MDLSDDNINNSSDNNNDDDAEEEAPTFEQLATELLRVDETAIANIQDPESYTEIAEFFHQIWCDPDIGFLQIHERNLAFFGSQTDTLERYKFYSTQAIALDGRLSRFTEEERQMLENQKKQVSDILRTIKYAYESTVQTYQQIFCSSPDMAAMLPPTSSESLFSPVSVEDYKSHQKLIVFLLEECARRFYRRQGKSLYAPKYTEEGEFTRTFTYAIDVKPFIYDAVYPRHQNPWLFQALTERSSVVRQCEDHLENCVDDNLPVLRKDRTRFAYKNGLYDALEDRFYVYGSPPEGWDSRVACANYIDVVFDSDLYDQFADPLDIPTPNVQTILDSQDFDPEVCRWMYASMGRMIFEIGTTDNWQYFPFCKGTAGSGKSTLLRLVARFYNDIDVGNLMSSGQRNFSVEHLYDKLLFFCYDLDDNMTFELTRFNQMVSGEDMSIERKGKVSIPVKWAAPGGFAGNSFPPWVDQGGSFSRRILLFLFNKTVKNVDPNLGDKCKAELAAFMKKCVSCYHDLRARHGDRGIYDSGVVPEYFHNTKRKMQAETNPLQAFVMSDHCEIVEGATCDFNEFRSAYLAFCDTHKLPKKNLSPDFCTPVFDGQGITINHPIGQAKSLDGISVVS